MKSVLKVIWYGILAILYLFILFQIIAVTWQIFFVTTNGCEKYKDTPLIEKPFRCLKHYYE